MGFARPLNPKLWLDYSTNAFKKLGLNQSKFDLYQWCGNDIMLVQYVDDCGISAPYKKIRFNMLDIIINLMRPSNLHHHPGHTLRSCNNLV